MIPDIYLKSPYACPCMYRHSNKCRVEKRRKMKMELSSHTKGHRRSLHPRNSRGITVPLYLGTETRMSPAAEIQLHLCPSIREKSSASICGVFWAPVACNDLMLSVKLGCVFCLSPEKTGHAEVVRVVYQPERVSFEELLKVFWENHDPTQGRVMSEPVFNYLTNYSWDN